LRSIQDANIHDGKQLALTTPSSMMPFNMPPTMSIAAPFPTFASTPAPGCNVPESVAVFKVVVEGIAILVGVIVVVLNQFGCLPKNVRFHQDISDLRHY
jgi:hypothetical protein